jgi:hypothetical protein
MSSDRSFSGSSSLRVVQQHLDSSPNRQLAGDLRPYPAVAPRLGRCPTTQQVAEDLKSYPAVAEDSKLYNTAAVHSRGLSKEAEVPTRCLIEGFV